MNNWRNLFYEGEIIFNNDEERDFLIKKCKNLSEPLFLDFNYSGPGRKFYIKSTYFELAKRLWLERLK